jgi:hypothetical protein
MCIQNGRWLGLAACCNLSGETLDQFFTLVIVLAPSMFVDRYFWRLLPIFGDRCQFLATKQPILTNVLRKK